LRAAVQEIAAMANLNKVMLIGRLTRDPEVRTFTTGGKVAKFGFAVSNRRKNQQTGQWEDEPCFVDCSVFNRGENGRQADLVEQSLRKGHQVFLEGHLVFEQWDDKNTQQKRSALKVVVDNFQFLERRDDGGMGDGSSRPARTSPPPAHKPAAYPSAGGFEEQEPLEPQEGGNEEIPF
jgi:single-strand DNA-binding protein